MTPLLRLRHPDRLLVDEQEVDDWAAVRDQVTDSDTHAFVLLIALANLVLGLPEGQLLAGTSITTPRA